MNDERSPESGVRSPESDMETGQPLRTQDSGLRTIEEAQRLLEDAKTERRVAECERTLHGLLSATKLPQPFQDKLRKRFAGSVTSAESIQEAFDEEAAALASVLDGQLITGMGAEKASITSRVYARYDYMREKREALHLWADRLAGLVSGGAEIVLLGSRGAV